MPNMPNIPDNVIDEVSSVLQGAGYTLKEFMHSYLDKNHQIFEWNDSLKKQFEEMYRQIKNNEGVKQTAQDKGVVLERLASCLFENENKLFEISNNLRTSTNEIDLLIRWTPNAKCMGINDMYHFMNDTFICECKNYNKKIGVTYIGKFYSLLKSSRLKFGILFSWEGVTGRKWESGNGLIKKIALKDEIYIISIDKYDLEKIAMNNKSFFEVLDDKYESLRNDIDISTNFKKHELEEEIRNTIEGTV